MIHYLIRGQSVLNATMNRTFPFIHTKLCGSIKCLLLFLVSITFSACILNPTPSSHPGQANRQDNDLLRMQSFVMNMADDNIAELGESIYLLTRSGHLDSKGRWLAQSFLRNGVAASLDIAVGPNPSVSVLDLLVLISLQAWSFEQHWIPAGIGDAGYPALERLKTTEQDAWNTAKQVLTGDQLRTLRSLIDAWIAENPERTVIALVRFNEFSDKRRVSSLALHGEAISLLREVSEASAAVDEARLLGERLFWFAGRYPYVLGEQAELTAYRLIDQPEGLQLIETMKSAKELSDAFTERLETMQSDLEQQQGSFFSQLSAERQAAIDQLFEKLVQERTQLLDEISAREAELLGMMSELRQTIIASGALADDLTGTVNAIDRVLSHFDQEPGGQKEPLRMLDIRDAAIETGRAAERLTAMLERANQILESEPWQQAMTSVTDPADDLVDQIFWRGLVLIGVLILGIGLLRLVPQKITNRHDER